MSFKVGDVVYCEGSELIEGDVTKVDEDGVYVTWRQTESLEQPEDLFHVGETREPTDDQIYNRPGVEGGIAYDPMPESGYHEHDWRL